jgi:hypothetical protein
MCTACVGLLVAGGLAAAAVPRAPAAPAQEEPPTTTAPAPAPDPTPDPAPPIKPKPKPKPKARPAPAPAPRPSRPAPAPTPQPTFQAPRVQTQKPAVKRPVRKATKNVPKKAPVKPKPVTTPTIKPVGGSLGASIGLRNPAQAKSGDAFDFSALVIVLGLTVAIACFAVAVIPATHVPWRPAAIFVSERQVDLTVLGFALLTLGAFAFFWTKGL